MIGTVAGFIANRIERGYDDAREATEGQALAALARANDYIEANYRTAWLNPQAVTNVERAVYIAAAYELSEPGFWSKTWTEGDRKVLTEVGDSIKWTLASEGGARGRDAVTPKSTLIDGLLDPFSYRLCYPTIMSA